MHLKSKVDGFLCLCSIIPPLRLIFFAGGSIDSKGCFILEIIFLRRLEAEELDEDEKNDRNEDVLDFVEVEDDIVRAFKYDRLLSNELRGADRERTPADFVRWIGDRIFSIEDLE